MCVCMCKKEILPRLSMCKREILGTGNTNVVVSTVQ
jgi:hypothetical protein